MIFFWQIVRFLDGELPVPGSGGGGRRHRCLWSQAEDGPHRKREEGGAGLDTGDLNNILKVGEHV